MDEDRSPEAGRTYDGCARHMPPPPRTPESAASRPSAGEERLAWLNEATHRIGTTLDLEVTAQEFVDFVVPRVADGASVDLLDSVLLGEDGMRAPQSRIPPIRATALSLVDGLSLEPDPVGEITRRTDNAILRHCLTTREPFLANNIGGDQYEKIALSPSAAAAMRREGVHALLKVPLIARGVLLGIVDFVRARNPEPFGPADVALALELVSKAAIFIDNARLYSREREVVVALQRTMLPRSAPATPGLDVATHYFPTIHPAGVGGDWFDVVELPGGRTALVVGDVMSHGLAGAATMGRLRTVARTLMALDIAPERVLARLDLAARDLEEDQVATCLCVVYDPADGTCTVASAGHLPPLLVDADGRARYADVPPGAPLGAGLIPYDPVRLKLPCGSRIVLYTDGLAKNRVDDITAQQERLRAAVEGAQPPLPEACARIVERLGAPKRIDDAVVLVAAARPLGADEEPRAAVPADQGGLCMWELAADGSAAREARRLVRGQLDHWDLAHMSETVELVVSELVGNALRYGGGPGMLRLLRHDRLVVELSDQGPDLPQIQHAGLSDEGGRGLQLINMLCRRWGSCRTAEGKVVWAEQDIPGVPFDW